MPTIRPEGHLAPCGAFGILGFRGLPVKSQGPRIHGKLGPRLGTPGSKRSHEALQQGNRGALKQGQLTPGLCQLSPHLSHLLLQRSNQDERTGFLGLGPLDALFKTVSESSGAPFH